MNISTKHAHIFFGIITLILILLSIIGFDIFKYAKNEIKDNILSNRLKQTKIFSNKIKNFILKFDKDFSNTPLIQNYLNSFITPSFPYIYILKIKNNKLYMLIDGNKELYPNQPFIVENIKEYLNTKTHYFYHKKNKQLFITYITPITKNKILVIDISTKILKMIDSSLKYVNYLFKAFLFLLTAVAILIFITFKKYYNINQELEERVKEEIEKNRQKDLQLIKQSRLATMGQIISMIAHQWRQPLSAISNYANEILLQIMLNNLNKKELENNATKIVNLTQNLSQLINDFREFYKEDKEKSLTSLNEILKKVQNIASASLKNYNINFIIENTFNEKFKCFPNELAQVILNIIQNSKDAILEKNIKNPFIKVKTYKADNYIVIEIEDNAGGIPEKYKDKIFEPYFSTKSKNGTGLGLYMSKMIIEKHCNGKLYFKNTKNGVKFIIELRLDNE